MKKATIVNILSIFTVILTAFQGLIPTMPLSNTVIISAVVMYLVTTCTVWKQSLSKEIANSAIWPTIIVAIVATIGGLNDIVKVVHIAPVIGQWIRFGITFVTLTLNMLSKVLWPTPQTSSTI